MKHDTAYLVKSGFLREKIGDWGWQNGLTDHQSMVRKALTLMALVAFAIPQFIFSVASATVPQVIVVPFSQTNPL